MRHKLLGNTSRGRLFIVSAPSGTGKSTLVEMLCSAFDCVERSISCTTRAPRSSEKEGVDYYFMSAEQFAAKEKAGAFLETAKVYKDSYGTLKESVEQGLNRGKHRVLVLDTQGARAVRKQWEAVSIFIAPPSYEELQKRLSLRNLDSCKSVEERLSWVKHEMEEGKNYDYYIVNDDLNIAFEVLKSIFIAEEHRVKGEIHADW